MTFPPDFTMPKEKTVTAQAAAQSIAGLAPARRVVVQAGGCAGLWPLALAHYFAHVVTFEPDAQNFTCLRANVAARPNISAFDYALGNEAKLVGLTRPKPGAGLWRIDGDGDVQMIRLDDFVADLTVDALVLDVEGSEVAALKGAETLIATHRPLLWFEFLHHTEAIEAVLAEYGYTPPERGLGGDCYSVHSSRAH